MTNDEWDILRPRHWPKNVFVLAGLVFSQKLSGTGAGTVSQALLAAGQALGAFVCFCLVSSAVYIFNDLVDRKTDALHPQKGQRPIASGRVTQKQAIRMMVFCLSGSLIGSYLIEPFLTLWVIVYFGLMVFYSMSLKRVMILDCIVIAVGFCLRAVAGAVAVDVMISAWLVICTFALCLFLGFGKRRSEIEQLTGDAQAYRQTLAGYTPELLAHMMNVTSGLAIVCFLLYATDAETELKFGNDYLAYTMPLVLFCIFRFSALIQTGTYSGPVQVFWADRPFQLGLFLWAAACMAILYG